MGHICREKAEFPIPARAHINHNNAQVSIYELDAKGHRTGSRTVIGLAASDTTMHPNENFRLLFPDLREKYYAEQTPVYQLHVVLYAALLGLGHQTGIYPLLDRLLGHPDANVTVGGSLTANVSGSATISASSITLDTPTVTATGNMTIAGTLTAANGTMTASGGSFSMTGSITSTGDVTADGISLTGHQHSCPDGTTSAPFYRQKNPLKVKGQIQS